ncbi:hypothetical protein QMK34_03225 [Amycolatopsis sp. H20-H5]|nr:hypothetical protein [Amycolatopsis sp. H20-H5]
MLDSASATFDGNSTNVGAVASHFDYTQSNVKKMPSPPPETSFWDRAKPWDTDTEKAVNDYNATARQNLELYNAYSDHTSTSSGALRADYGDLGTFADGDLTIAKDPVTPPPDDKSTPGDVHHESRTTQPVTPPPPRPWTTPLSTTVSPGDHSAGAHTGTGSGTGVGSGGRTAVPPGSVRGEEDTVAAGYAPSADPPGPRPGPGTGWLPLGTSVGTGSGASTTPYVGVGDLGNVTGGKALPGQPGAGGVPGGGRQSGTGLPGGPGTSGGAIGGAGKSAGSRAQGGPGGMAQAGRGTKEEDAEHQRKYVLDSDTLFTDEARDDLDPTTGLPPVPPTIGA